LKPVWFSHDFAGLQAAIDDNTALFSVNDGNPAGNIVDIEML